MRLRRPSKIFGDSFQGCLLTSCRRASVPSAGADALIHMSKCKPVLCSGRVSDGNLILYLTQHVAPPVLKGLRFSFSSTTPFSRMIEHISGEYGLAAEHRDLGSGHAIWKLSKDKVLELSYRG